MTTDEVHERICDERDALQAEVERLKTEGSPGVMHAVDKAFYDLTVKQRDAAWREVEHLKGVLLDTVKNAHEQILGTADDVTKLGGEAMQKYGDQLVDTLVGPLIELRDELKAKLAAVQTLHSGKMPYGGEAHCQGCGKRWPCPTIAVLDGAAT